MAQVELIMPKMGESVAEATIIKWLKKEGDLIAADETVLEIATDKVDTEIPSTAAGVLIKCLFKEGDIVQVGKAIAIISTDVNASVEAPELKTTAPAQVSTVIKEQISSPAAEIETIERNSSSGKFFSPLVRNIAKAEHISVAELESISGTGANGRITKNDILAYIPNKGKQTAIVQNQPEQQLAKVIAPTNGNGASNSKPAISLNAGDEVIEMDRMRKLIADHMVMSKHTSAHVTSFVEADVTNVVLWRERVKKDFEKREGEKLTFTPIFIEALAKAIKDFPMINISLDGTKIIKRKNINIGMATALPSGNLIVPVIKNADTLNLIGLTKQVNSLANKARNGKLTPDDIQGGTYTISNVGSFGNVMGTPIINQPQVAILAVGVIKKKPAVIETEAGDLIGIRHFMYLSHSYDHRVVDGSLGGQFVRRVADYLEQWDTKREF
ncbi:MAG: 2-oxo acid dehydrogenase subunit E2 [Bacteroidetes bacterium]|nr:2-oxo acid dehydrogenase subunit E2 [Bacteroidota bacterium]